jgi:predicted transcriptional regulator
MANPTNREQVFFSYSRKDKKWLERFQATLKPLIRANQLSVWDDTKIEAGDIWRDEIKQALASAKVAVLLVTTNFLNSDFIAEHELPPLLEAAQKEGLRILLVVIGHSLFEETELGRYQAVNDPSKPLAGMTAASREKEIVRICREIKAVVPSPPTVMPKVDAAIVENISGEPNYYSTPDLQAEDESTKNLIYTSDDIWRSLVSDAESHKEEGRPSGKTSKIVKERPIKLAWNEPWVACSLLSNISGLQTGDYKSSGTEDDFFCCSPYKDLDHESPLPNNIAYYAEGDAEEVNRLKLVLYVNDSDKAEAAHRALMIYSNELACKALGEELRPKMQDAILAGRPYAYKVGELFVELKVEAWVTERGYDMKFMITRPINILSPLMAKVGSTAHLPSSNLDYEPDETAIRILVFLAEPQHQTVYAVEIGNSLGLSQTLVKSYLDKLAEVDYVLITSDSRTNSDVCTITPKGKEFMDKPVRTVPFPSGHDELDPPKIKILQLLADENCPPYTDSLSIVLEIHQVRLKEHLDVLIERGWVTANEFDEWHAAKFKLTRKARQFLINNDHIK